MDSFAALLRRMIQLSPFQWIFRTATNLRTYYALLHIRTLTHYRVSAQESLIISIFDITMDISGSQDTLGGSTRAPVSTLQDLLGEYQVDITNAFDIVLSILMMFRMFEARLVRAKQGGWDSKGERGRGGAEN